METLPGVRCFGIISACGKYRYRLTRCWASPMQAKKWITFVMLNPSTASGGQDDRTIRKCMMFSAAWGYNMMEVLNLFAYRETKPSRLFARAGDIIGPMNKDYLLNAQGEVIVVAWGEATKFSERAMQVLDMLKRNKHDLRCLDKTADGSPRHPLYMRGDTVLKPYP